MRQDPPVPTASSILGLLAENRRLRVVAALVLGARSPAVLAERTGLAERDVRRALDRLVRGGLVEIGPGGPEVAVERIRRVVRDAAEARAARAVTPEDLGATPEQLPVLKNFLIDGRLLTVPSARGKRRVVLEFLSMQFEPGRIYPERDVNRMLEVFNPDYAALRRYLVDEEFLERRQGFYWRAGGPVDVDQPDP